MRPFTNRSTSLSQAMLSSARASRPRGIIGMHFGIKAAPASALRQKQTYPISPHRAPCGRRSPYFTMTVAFIMGCIWQIIEYLPRLCKYDNIVLAMMLQAFVA